MIPWRLPDRDPNLTMKKPIGFVLPLALSLAAVPFAHAHVFRGSLGKAASAMDIIDIPCGTGGDSLRLDVEVLDLKPVKPPRLLIQVLKDGVTANAIDPKDADRKYSPIASVAGGTGTYRVSISKLESRPGRPDRTRKHAELYQAQIHCMVGNVEQPGDQSKWRYIQNQ
jgi:hypothetical protein